MPSALPFDFDLAPPPHMFPTTELPPTPVDPPAASPIESDPTHFLALSPAALHGTASPSSLRVTGYILGSPVTILIDTRSTHNKIQPRVASFLCFPTDPYPSFPVMVGNGAFIHCSSQCSTVPIRLADASFSLSLFLLPIEGAAIVLGMSWLSSLSLITADFAIPQITFTHHNRTITLHGEPTSSPTTPSAICHLIQKQSVAEFYTSFATHSQNPSNGPVVHIPHPPLTSLPCYNASITSLTHLQVYLLFALTTTISRSFRPPLPSMSDPIATLTFRKLL